MTPVVGYIGELSQLNLQSNPDEVEYLFTLSFEELLDESKWTYNDFATPVFNDGNGIIIWGLTAYLLSKFIKDVVRKCSASLDTVEGGVEHESDTHLLHRPHE